MTSSITVRHDPPSRDLPPDLFPLVRLAVLLADIAASTLGPGWAVSTDATEDRPGPELAPSERTSLHGASPAGLGPADVERRDHPTESMRGT